MNAEKIEETGPCVAERAAESGAAAVLQLLRGEDLETVSRSLGVTAATLSGWREAFLTAGEAALAAKPAPPRGWKTSG